MADNGAPLLAAAATDAPAQADGVAAAPPVVPAGAIQGVETADNLADSVKAAADASAMLDESFDDAFQKALAQKVDKQALKRSLTKDRVKSLKGAPEEAAAVAKAALAAAKAELAAVEEEAKEDKEEAQSIEAFFVDNARLEVEAAQAYTKELEAKGITSLEDLLAKPMVKWGIEIKKGDNPKILHAVKEHEVRTGQADWDISHGPRVEGKLGTLGMILPAVTRIAAGLVGAAGMTTGYALGKVGEGITGSKAVDSTAFQVGFISWMYSNGIFPSVQWEPLGETEAALKQLYGTEVEYHHNDINITPMIVSNHISYLDGLVLAACFGSPRVVAKAGVRKIPIMGKLGEEQEVIFVDRAAGDSRKATAEAIMKHCEEWTSGSRPLLVFPEGTTTNGEIMTTFKKGSFNPGVPVRPVIMVYTGQFDPANTTYYKDDHDELHEMSDAEWMGQFMGHFLHSVHVRVLPPYFPSEAEKADSEKYAAAVQAYMEEHLERVRKEVTENSWKAMAGRKDGGLGWQWGDGTRWFWRKVGLLS